MSDATSLLYDLPGFRVMSCSVSPLGVRRVAVMQVAAEYACPRCGVRVGGKPYDVREMRIKDLPFGHWPVEAVWRKRRYRCGERLCPQRVFTERSGQVPPRWRLTDRLRARLEQAASRFGAGSPTSLGTTGCRGGACTRRWPTRRSRSPRRRERRACSAWTRPGPGRCAGSGTTRTGGCPTPWMTSLVGLDAGRPGWLLGLVPGRAGAAVESWLAAQPAAWRAAIQVVALDPFAPFAAAIRRLFPQATIVVDHCIWSGSPTRRSLTFGSASPASNVAGTASGIRRGHTAGCCFAAGDWLSRRGLARLRSMLALDDPTNEISAAWGVKELLRQLLAAPTAHDARHRLFRLSDAVLIADMPETTRLAETISTWWPAIEAFLRLRVTNARTEGTNRVIGQLERSAAATATNLTNYNAVVVLHVALRSAA